MQVHNSIKSQFNHCENSCMHISRKSFFLAKKSGGKFLCRSLSTKNKRSGLRFLKAHYTKCLPAYKRLVPWERRKEKNPKPQPRPLPVLRVNLLPPLNFQLKESCRPSMTLLTTGMPVDMDDACACLLDTPSHQYKLI